MSKTRLGPAAAPLVLVLASLMLSGCGSASSPGVAIEVGEETISISEVDDLTEDYCAAIEPQLEANDQTVPKRFFRGGLAGELARRSVADQLAEDHGVEAGDRYDDRVASLEESTATLDEDVQEAVIHAELAGTYVEAVQVAVGQVLLAEEGVTDARYSDQRARGATAYNDWIAEHGVSFDPQLGIELVDGEIQQVDTSVSHAWGDTAQAGAAEEPDPAYAAALPPSQRCG